MAQFAHTIVYDDTHTINFIDTEFTVTQDIITIEPKWNILKSFFGIKKTNKSDNKPETYYGRTRFRDVRVYVECPINSTLGKPDISFSKYKFDLHPFFGCWFKEREKYDGTGYYATMIFDFKLKC